MKITFYIVFIVFFLVYILINYYIGLRGWQYLGVYMPYLKRTVYWAIFWLIAISYLAGRVSAGFFPAAVRYYLTVVGSYWLAAMFYLLQLLLILDLIKFLNRCLHFLPPAFQNNPRTGLWMGLATVCLITAILIYGAWNAQTPRTKYYNISVPKQAGDLDRLHIVMISDIHLGEIMHNGRLVKLVNIVEALKPDIILLPGDVIDEDIGTFIKQDMDVTFRKLNPTYGIYAVPGNHEYIGGQIDMAVHYLQQAGIRVLRDEYIKIAGSFYVIGRDEAARAHFTGEKELKSLSQTLKDIDKSLPLILLSHQPTKLDEAAENGIDLQLSGHTHRGQLFPINFITRAIFETDHGYIEKGDFRLLVSSGFGTWGPPIRIGNEPEIVDIVLNFVRN